MESGCRFTPTAPGWAAPALALGLALSSAPGPAGTARAADLQFNRDIRPVLSDACFHCHGPDPGTRKAGLRLDTREGLFGQTKKEGPVITPGNTARSALWTRLTTTDPDDVMPPPDSHKTLTAGQRDAIRRWIESGAPWQPHWAFVKPERPPLPAVRQAGWVRHPLDAFVLARLEAAGLSPAPEADRRTLARRAALDLTGLPPMPEDVERFVGDPAPDAYERYVDRLMDSPRWGEHRGRYWLDAARYADTHGLHFDNYREMWPYRDWVIRAFNRNQPFDQFTLEQVAGDLLPNAGDEQLVATGFHRCNMTTNEGGTIEEENQVNYANDRVTTTSWVWLGLTANCAACHDHKFDPISMRDFYSMAALFRNTTQSGFDGNVKDGANASLVVVTDPADRARWERLPGEIESAKSRLEKVRRAAEGPFNAWAGSLRFADLEQGLRQNLALSVPLDEGSGPTVKATVAGTPVSFPVSGSHRWKPEGRPQPALQLDATATVEIPAAGDFDTGQAFSFGAWVFLPPDFNESRSVFARMDESADHRGWDFWHEQGKFGAHLIHKWPDDALKVVTRKRVGKKGQWQHVFVSYDGSGRPEGVKIFIDGEAAETDAGPSRLQGTMRTRVPFRLAQRSDGPHFTGLGLQDVRIYSRALAAPEVRTLARAAEMQQLLARPLPEWKPEERAVLMDYFLTGYVPVHEARAEVARLEQEREGIRLKYPVTHIQREKKDAMPAAFVLYRGQYDKRRDQVEGGVFSALPPLPEGAPRNRLGLARWLVSPDNPLTARVTVNRFWQELFGVGLVKTAEEFGIMGEKPVNPELLDWLAVEFREEGWDVKRLFRLMVTSATYRQSAVTTPLKLEKDPGNRLLSRGPRFRMDAEMVRDYALATSGLLSGRVGGPSVKPYQPEGVWEAVAMPESNTKRYERDTGESLYRRSLYTFWKRAAPPASMDLFNAPSRETCAVRRERTNTPLQALATLNDPQFIEAARRLAEAGWQASRGQAGPAVDWMARRVLARPLNERENDILRRTLADLQAHYAGHDADATAFLRVGEAVPDASIPAPQLAALTLVANQLLNLDEVLNK